MGRGIFIYIEDVKGNIYLSFDDYVRFRFCLVFIFKNVYLYRVYIFLYIYLFRKILGCCIIGIGSLFVILGL